MFLGEKHSVLGQTVPTLRNDIHSINVYNYHKGTLSHIFSTISVTSQSYLLWMELHKILHAGY